MANWLDKYKYGGEAGYTDIPFKYNSAWGGQFQMGGSIPGSVGFTYARTQGIPSEGPYAKKTLPSAEDGMTYYQHGLDWKPKTISKDGSLIPIAQTGEFVLPRYDMPRAASESTAILRDTVKGKKTTATTGQKKEDVKSSTEAMGKAKKAEKEEEKQRVAERKAAVAAKDKGKPFTLPTGETKKYEDMSAREKMYVSGKALEQRGRFNENEESFFDEWVNPLNLIGGMAGGLATAPYEAKESDSNLPYVGAIANPVMAGMLGFDPLGGALKAPSKVAQSMESGLLSNTYKLNPKAFKPQEGMMYRGLGKEGMEDAIQSGVFRPKQHGYAEGRSLAEKVTTPKQFGSTFYAPAERFEVVQNYGPSYLAEVPFEGNEFARRYGRKDWSWSTPRQIPIEEGRILQKDWLRGYKEVPKQNKGGVIKDDRGQWAHPGEITEIGSNEITMQGVPYPVLGISDKGDTQMMFPEQEYKFKGKKVIEYPITQKVNQKSTGGWLNKYK